MLKKNERHIQEKLSNKKSPFRFKIEAGMKPIIHLYCPGSFEYEKCNRSKHSSSFVWSNHDGEMGEGLRRSNTVKHSNMNV